MGRIYPTEAIAAVKALAQARATNGEWRHTTAEIQRMLAAGEIPGVPACEMKLRTLQDHAAAARRRVDPLPEDTIDATNALDQAALRIVQREIHELGRKGRKTRLTPNDALALKRHTETLDTLRRARTPAKPAHPDRVAGGKATQEARRAQPKGLIARIAADQERERGADSGEPPNNGTQTSDEDA